MTRGDAAELTAALGAEPFIDLVTFRRDGRAVHTPVWVGTNGERLFVSTFGYSGKVLRARNNPLVAVTACSGHGDVGPEPRYVAAQCEVLNKSEFRPGVRAFKAKYGIHFSLMWATRWGFRVVGKGRVWMLISLTPEQPLPFIPPPSLPQTGTH